MNPASLTRAERYQLNRAMDAAKAMVIADGKFFARFPNRRHRIRVASAAEVEIQAIMGKSLGAGLRWFAVVRHLSDGVVLQIVVPHQAALAGEVEGYDEDFCREVYQTAAPPGSGPYEVEQGYWAAANGQ